MNIDDLLMRINDLQERLALAENAMALQVQKNAELRKMNRDLYAERIAAETRIAELEQHLSGK